MEVLIRRENSGHTLAQRGACHVQTDHHTLTEADRHAAATNLGSLMATTWAGCGGCAARNRLYPDFLARQHGAAEDFWPP